MADWKKKRRATRMKGSPGSDPCVEQDAEFEHDARHDINYPTATGRSLDLDNMPTLGALLQSYPRSHQKQDLMESPTTPFGFVPSPVRQPYHSHNFSVNRKVPKLYDPTDSPTTPSTPSPLGSPAKRQSHRSPSMNTRVMKHGKIQKSSFGRSQSFGGKYGYRGPHMDSLQNQLYSTMRTLGVDHETVVERLDGLDMMKQLYLNRGEQSTPDSPLSGGQTPLPAGDHPARVSTIALLKHKFAQFEKLKESNQCQQIPLYPSQNYHAGQSPSSQRSTTTSSSCSPSMAPTSDSSSSYEFDETTTALLAMQQEMMWTSFGRSTPSGNSNVTNSSDSWSSSPNWYSRGGDSPTSSISRGGESPDVAASDHKLPPLKGGRHSNVGALQDASLRGGRMGDTGSGGLGPDTLVSLFEAENLEATKPAPKCSTDWDKKIATSIEIAMAKLYLSPKLSSLKYKVLGGPRGTGLSMSTPPNSPFFDHSARGSCGSGVTETCRNNVQSSISEVECPDNSMEHDEFIDTSLRL